MIRTSRDLEVCSICGEPLEVVYELDDDRLCVDCYTAIMEIPTQ